MSLKSNIHIVAILALISTGCGRSNSFQNDFEPLKNHFGILSHVESTYPMHKAVSASLVYQNPNGSTVVIWPYIDAVAKIQITSNYVVLVGGKADAYKDGHERLSQRLIAFEAPSGPPMDITDDVLKKYCVKSGVAFTNIIKDSYASLIETNGLLQIDFGIIKTGLRGEGSIDAEDGAFVVSWDEIKSIMAEVKKTGKLKKEKWSGVEYFQKE